MPTGYEYSQKEKQLIFTVIDFVEREKSGWIIPLYSVNERLKAMLGISMSSVERLKREFRQEKEWSDVEQRRAAEEALKEQNSLHKLPFRLRHRSSSGEERERSTAVTRVEGKIPIARAPTKVGNCGRPVLILSEQQQEQIR